MNSKATDQQEALRSSKTTTKKKGFFGKIGGAVGGAVGGVANVTSGLVVGALDQTRKGLTAGLNVVGLAEKDEELKLEDVLPLKQILKDDTITMFLVNGNDDNFIYFTQDENSLNIMPGMPGFLSSKKKDNKQKHAVMKYDIHEQTS